MKGNYPSVKMPRAFAPLFEEARYKIFYGGRGGAKSYSVALYLVISMLQEQLPNCVYGCFRDVGESTFDSVKPLIMHFIQALGVESQFYTTETSRRILCKRNGSYFLFGGISNEKQINKIKSQPFLQKVWIEEGHTTPENVWDILTPSVRASKDSEIIVTFNPNKLSDFVYQRFVVSNNTADAIVRKVNYYDNPYFEDNVVLEKERQACMVYPAKYRRIWLGEAGYFERQLIRPHWWKWYDDRNAILPTLNGMFLVADTAYKEREIDDFSVVNLWGYEGALKLYLLDQIRGKYTFPVLVEKIKAFITQTGSYHPRLKPDRIYIEDKGSGTSIAQTFRHGGYGAVDWLPKEFGLPNDKIGRVNACTTTIQKGMVYLPKHAPWVNDFVDEHSNFGELEDENLKDDQVDTTTMAISIWRCRGGGVRI